MPTISEKVRVVASETPVSLTIEIGSGQIGGYSVMLDSEELTPKSKDETRAEYSLGTGEHVQFRVLIGVIKVQDVNPATDQTTVTVTVTQGNAQRIFRDSEKAKPGGKVNYGLAISFV